MSTSVNAGRLEILQRLLAVAALTVLTAGTAHAAPGQGRIYYVDEAKGNLISAAPDGSNEVNLTGRHDLPGVSGEPSPSWDGRKIVFTQYLPGAGGRPPSNADLYMVDSDGSNLQRLTRSPVVDERTPAFAVGDKKILFSANVDAQIVIESVSRYEIYSYDLVDGRRQRVTDLDHGLTTDPAPASDGNSLAVASYNSSHVLTGIGDELKDLTAAENECDEPVDPCPREGSPSFSPDMALLVFTSDRLSGVRQIFVSLANGTLARKLALGDGAEEPWWSPDGESIVYQSADGQICVTAVPAQDSVSCVAHGSQPRWGADPAAQELPAQPPLDDPPAEAPPAGPVNPPAAPVAANPPVAVAPSVPGTPPAGSVSKPPSKGSVPVGGSLDGAKPPVGSKGGSAKDGRPVKVCHDRYLDERSVRKLRKRLAALRKKLRRASTRKAKRFYQKRIRALKRQLATTVCS